MRYGLIIPISQTKGLFYLGEALANDLIRKGNEVFIFARFWDHANLPDSILVRSAVNWELKSTVVRRWAEDFKIDKVIILESWGRVIKEIVDELKKYAIPVIDVPMWEMVNEDDYIDGWYNKFDEIWCLTNSCYKLFSKKYEKSTRVLIDAVDHNIFHHWKDSGYKKSSVYTFVIAPGDPLKLNTASNFDSVLWAFRKLRETYQANLIILGRSGYEDLVKEEEGIKLIRHLLTREHLAKIFIESHCFLATTSREGFAMMPREALASGMSVIGIDVPPINEIAGIRLVSPIKLESIGNSLIPAAKISGEVLYALFLRSVKEYLAENSVMSK